jgi:hypothetical protein
VTGAVLAVAIGVDSAAVVMPAEAEQAATGNMIVID